MALVVLAACSSRPEPATPKPSPPVRFESLDAERTGIDFTNGLPHDHQRMNLHYFQYFYNGAGVAIGDVNGDDLPDLFFAGNFADDELYLNRGAMKFEDASEASGIAANQQGWSTGAAMVDIDADGDLDIYVSRGAPVNPQTRRNQLLINDGEGHFTEQADQFGLGDRGHSTHAAFLDYDLDGDLDVFVLNHPVTRLKLEGQIPILRGTRVPDVADRLYRNDGGTFTDVSLEAHLLGNALGYGLSVAVGDVNDDGWPDLFVANDYIEPDYLYVNKQDGTFEERLQPSIPHISNFSMGSDLVDIDNDGRLDLLVADMAAPSNYRAKTMMQSMNIPQFRSQVMLGFHYQYSFNVLQRNNGDGTFSDIAQLAGIARSDWSWAILGFDFDNDGWRDIYVTNGRPRTDSNVDFRRFKTKLAEAGPIEGARLAEVLRQMPDARTPNHAFRNRGDLTFEDVSEKSGLDLFGASTGAAYADLDRDGDLDLVVNNTNAVASIYENKIRDAEPSHYLRVTFAGPEKNPGGIGARVTIEHDDRTQTAAHYTSRGYKSSVEPGLHFGTGWSNWIDELTVRWPDGRVQTLTGLGVDQELVLEYADAKPARPEPTKATPLLTDVTATSGLSFVHRENEFDDFDKEVLLPYETSKLGPALAVGDVQGDNLDDVYIGGATGQAGALFVQAADGRFRRTPGPWDDHADREDVGALFFDADGDGDVDLYVGSGGNEHPAGSPLLQDRLYLNEGGSFEDASDRLPPLRTSAGVVVASDIDGDNDQDLFVGGRLVPGQYPKPPRSAVLVNTNGRFADATDRVAPQLSEIGMVTAAEFADLDGDGDRDLALVGEWMPVVLATNDNGVFSPQPIPRSEGWWQGLTVLDGEGGPRLVAGNVGRNIKFSTSVDAPFKAYAKDFDGSGTLDIVLASSTGDEEYPVRGRECSSQQMPFIKEKFPTYDAFGKATLRDVYGDDLDQALALRSNTFDSSVWSREAGSWQRHSLPNLAQIGTGHGIVPHDVNQDGHVDLVLAGNLEKTEVETTRIDGGTGLVLLGSADGSFEPLESVESGFTARGDVKALAKLRLGGGTGIVVARNHGPVSVFSITGR